MENTTVNKQGRSGANSEMVDIVGLDQVGTN